MAGPRRDASTLSPTPRGTRSRSARTATIALAALLAACTAATPSGSPPAATPGLGSPPATAPATPPATAAPTPADVPSAAPSPTPSPAPSEGPRDWTPVGAGPVAPVAAELGAVAGSSYAMDRAAGFRLRATGDESLAALLRRLRVEPALDYRVRTESGGRSAVLRPTEPLAPGAAYRFTLVDPAGAAVAGWAFQAAGPPRVVATLPADEATGVPTDTGIEATFDQDGVRVGDDDIVVRLLPSRARVAGRVEMHGRAAVFVPSRRLGAGRVYEVTVRAGTGRTDVQPGLAGAVVVTFATETAREAGAIRATLDASLYTSLPGERAAIAAQAWRDTEDGFENVSTPMRVRVYRLGSEAAALAALGRLEALPAWAEDAAPPRVPTADLPLAFSGRATWTRHGDGRALLMPKKTAPGWYLVELREGTPRQAVLQVTDVVGMIAARDDRLVAWVNDARTGQPVKGSAVAVVDGPTLGRTDATGVLLARTPAAVADATGTVLVRMTASGGRRVVVRLTGTSGVERNVWADTRAPDGDAWWTVFSFDRWLYRSTDTISAWGYLRGRDGKVPSAVELRVRREADDVLAARPIAAVAARLAGTGAFVAEVPLVQLPHGQYVLQVVADGRLVDTRSFAVGEIRKPAYRLAVEAAPRAVVAGTPIRATVTARFYDDTPAAAVPVVAEPLFGEESSAVAGVTGTDGRAALAVPTAMDEDEQYSCTSVQVRPDGPTEAEIFAHRRVCVFRGSELVDVAAVRDGTSVILRGAVHAVDLGAVERWLRAADDGADDQSDLPRGRPVAGRRVRLVITETVHRRVATGSWYDPIAKRVVETWEYEEIGSSDISRAATTAADGTYRLALPAPGKDRSWRVRATIVDRAGTEVSETAWLEDGVQSGEPGWYGVEIRGDTEVSIGATVTAQVVRSDGDRNRVVTPGGRDRFLFTIASPTRLAAVVRTAPLVRTRFLAADEPNLLLTAIWFTGREYVLPGAAAAHLDTEDRQVNVALATDRPRYEPGETAMITVRATDRAGRPVRASVVLRGLDEKLVAMGVAEIEDPLAELYESRPVGFVAGPAVSHEVALPGADGYGSTGGGGGGDGRVDFRDALPLRLVATGADGEARVAFELPDDVTSWRIGAAALTSTRRAGSASVLVPVGLPFFVDATLAPEYLVGDRVGIRLRAYGSALTADVPVRYVVSSATLGMAATTVNGRALRESVVRLPALTAGTHRVTIEATSAAGRDRLTRTFRVVDSRLTASRRERLAITGSVTPPGGPGVTHLVLVDAGRARYVERLLALASPGGQRADERLAATIARDLLVEELGLPAAELPAAAAFDRSVYQESDGGLALLPYASADLELTVRALVARPTALLTEPVRPWLRDIADQARETVERRTVALVGLAALGEPVLDRLAVALEDPSAGGRTHLWAALGLALLGDRQRAAAAEGSILERWGERRGDLLRLRITNDAEAVTEATELLALLAAWVDDPRAADALAYVASVPPREDLAVLAEVTVISRLVARLPAVASVVAVVQDGRRSTVRIPTGDAVVMEIVASQRAGLRLEPVSGSAAVVASWEEPVTAASALGGRDRDLSLTRTFTPPAPVPGNAYVVVRLSLRVNGPGRDGSVEVVDLAPSGLVPIEAGAIEDETCGPYGIGPARIDGQRVVFVASFSAPQPGDEDGADGAPTVPGTFCLAYQARVVTAGTYAWQPAVARQAASPGLVATSAASSVVLR